MSNPTNNFSFDLDPYDRLAQMYGLGLFDLLPLPPSWANYVRAQYAPDPSLPSAPASATPGFDKSPMVAGVGTTTPGFRPLPATPIVGTPGFDESPAVLEALAAADPRPAGFYRSPMFTGAGTTTPGFRPLPMTQIGDTPGFDKSPALLRAGLPPSSFDPSLMPTTGLPAMPFGGPGMLPSTTPPSIGSGFSRAGFSMPSLPPMTGQRSTPLTNDPSLVLVQASPPQSPSPPSPQPRPLQPVPPRPQSPIADSYDPKSENWRGYELVLPDGSTVADDPTIGPKDKDPSRSPTGHVMTPYLNLGEVATAGQLAGEMYRRQRLDPDTSLEEKAAALFDFARNAFKDVGPGGRFDYQRRGNQLGGLYAWLRGGPQESQFVHLRQFRPIANINVGLWGQQAGLTLEETLKLAGDFARVFSSNTDPNSQYGLALKTEYYTREGYRIGEQGLFRPRAQAGSPP